MQPPAPLKVRYPDGSIGEVTQLIVRRTVIEAWRDGVLVASEEPTVEVDIHRTFPSRLAMVAAEPDEDGITVTLAI